MRWADRALFRQAMIGYGAIDTTTNPDSIIRITPERHPEEPSLYPVSASLIGCIGVPSENAGTTLIKFADGGVVGTDSARIQVVYRSVDYIIKTDGEVAGTTIANGRELLRYVSRYSNFRTEVQKMPGHSYKFSPSNIQITDSLPRLIPTAEYTYVLHDWPQVPTAAISGAIGKVNNGTFDNATFAAETMLFHSYSYKVQYNSYGTLAYEISYKFLYRPSGWNKFWSKENGIELTIVTTNGGKLLYNLADAAGLTFNDLFGVV